jgi:hypothetical protein
MPPGRQRAESCTGPRRGDDVGVRSWVNTSAPRHETPPSRSTASQVSWRAFLAPLSRAKRDAHGALPRNHPALTVQTWVNRGPGLTGMPMPFDPARSRKARCKINRKPLLTA